LPEVKNPRQLLKKNSGSTGINALWNIRKPMFGIVLQKSLYLQKISPHLIVQMAFQKPLIKELVEDEHIAIIVFSHTTKKILQWIK
jgi:hypothetical protein